MNILQEIKNRTKGLTMRIVHRYLGFFLAGIMAMYAISGITLIFRESNFLKHEVTTTKQLKTNLSVREFSSELRIKGGLKPERSDGDIIYFAQGNYNAKTGIATVTKMELPTLLHKMQKLHKATTNSPVYWLNIFFGLALLFFVVSAFWMFMPETSIFKKGLYFSIAGILLTILLLLF